MKRFWRWLVDWLGSSPAQWEHERVERHRIGNELVRRWQIRQLYPNKEAK